MLNNASIDTYTLTTLIPSIAIVLFVLFFIAYGIIKLKYLMLIDPEITTYKEESKRFKEKSKSILMFLAVTYFFIMISISLSLVSFGGSHKSLSVQEITNNIKPLGGVCVAGESCGGEVAEEQSVVVKFSPENTFSSVCSSCHGVDASGGFGPALKGKEAKYITDRLVSYKNKEQIGVNSSIMWGQAASLSEDNISVLAEYLSSL